MITTPLIGAVIGYATNWVAVKMLFRPQKEVRLFGRRLPFTPGVIPKGKERLARAVGRAVEEKLLTREVLQEVLLSEEKKEVVRKAAADMLERQKMSQETLREAAERITSEEKTEHFLERAEETVTDMIYDKVLQKNVGEIIADKVLEIAKEKLKDSMFGMMLGGSLLEPIARQVEEKIMGVYEGFVVASAVMSPPMLEEALMLPKEQVELNVGTKNMMSVNVPIFQFEASNTEDIYSYGFVNTSGELDDSVAALKEVLPLMLELAQMEKSAQLLAEEIEKTRRRVNALEYVQIPSLQETIKYITMKLDENERGNLARLMKVKDMMIAETRPGAGE